MSEYYKGISSESNYNSTSIKKKTYKIILAETE